MRNMIELRPTETRRLRRAAIKLQNQKSLKLRRSTPAEGGDWIDQNGKVYDLVGPVPPKFASQQIDSFLKQIAKHDVKSIDYIVIDLDGFGPDEIKRILEAAGKTNKPVIILE